MTVVLFILILVVLIVVHEFGHFVVAKLSGMRVEEFGIGYPPKVWGKKWGETEYSLNALPFGGFVRISGEDDADLTDDPRSFAARPRILQALTLVAGVAMNLLLAYVLITGMLLGGAPQSLAPEEVATAKNVVLEVTSVLPGSPAAKAGLKPGDSITSAAAQGATSFSTVDPQAFTDYIAQDAQSAPLTLNVDRNGTPLTLTATPAKGVITAQPGRAALGVSISSVGSLPIAWYRAPIDGALMTWNATKTVAGGLIHFFGGVVTFTADLKQVAGPIGIAGAVGDAYHHGLASVLTITTLISINLALINLLPIPALDGGRLLFVAIEAVIRRRIPSAFSRAVNFAGYAFLILLMIAVTAHDILKIVA